MEENKQVKYGAIVDENSTLFDFSRISKDVHSKFEEYMSRSCDSDFFAWVMNNEFIEALDSVFSEKTVEGLLDSPPQILESFESQLKNKINNCYEGIVHYWPPIASNANNESKDILYLLVYVCSKLSPTSSLKLLQWLALVAIPEQYTNKKPLNSRDIKASCLCYRKRRIFREDRFFWALLTSENVFMLYRIENNQLILHKVCNVHSIRLSRSGNTIKFYNENDELLKRIVPIDPMQCSLWSYLNTSIPPLFPQFLSSSNSPVPMELLGEFYNALISDDMLVLRALTHFTVSKVADGLPLAEALFDVFSYSGRVNQLICQLSMSDFSAPELSHNTVLRGNSHLTCMFKVFFRRFGRAYYHKFLKSVVEYIDSKGDIGLKNPDSCDKNQAEVIVFTILYAIVNSIKYVPPEMKHFASVLKHFASLRFNSKQATYNTLSGFFCLRFLSSILANPKSFDSDIVLRNDFMKIMVPISQLLMNPFNLIDMRGKYSAFASWNHRINRHLFPKLFEFVFSVAEIDSNPEYLPPSRERLIESLQYIFAEIGKSKVTFSAKFLELYREKNLGSGAGWCFASFISSFFEQNI